MNPETSRTGKAGVWLSDPSASAVEIAAQVGYDTVVLDVEHGAFDLPSLNWLIPFIRARGMEALVKVLGPSREAIQQALDMGANAVAVPHIESKEHAAEVCGYAKFPPMGERSFAGGRTSRYGGFSDDWLLQQDLGTRCFPMIEDASAYRDIEEILALDVVDGIFVGPSDLSMRRNRGAYDAGTEDLEDIRLLAQAARQAGKPWVLPAWSPQEKELAVREDAELVILTMQYGALLQGFQSAHASLTKINRAPERVEA
ncbi:HpcH/HpaI aldolase family protein [Nesterenkonia natronophila]|uniref:4-hydroxy-2-oxovalerate aldolase n=1 Tax=Nesterenkonia natronophila TaxID=2174932 RepID=A0A3A4F9L2_9MICC|nr:aldolase/citrate lyase family protein [Nesterenkonia natronophila]RJN31887.1 4-hydroxy-2-oxovalerate aldolase [Nesterenkonia natronophila]